MKKIIIFLLVLTASKLLALEQKSVKQAKILPQIAVTSIDTTKKMSSQDWKSVENELKRALPKSLVKTMMKQLKSAEAMSKSGNTTDQRAIANLIAKGMADHADELDYELEKKEIIDDFKNGDYDSAAEKREARKEMKADLKELKKDYKESLKDKKKDKKAANTQFI
ncbi:hypothetical protein G7074_13210 [Pedobacter sp. HDW13]|uniref:hypothetical protein n=1 Tax=unclassified Pedobacter TaxID=2628915 RepID=UPI000F59AD04|nr:MULTISPECIES: hypothetical protein [unclassified Pedobacter]QIL40137.1 hypothetical protein G7074_13210 [Pedobacter sp. HDW13]RQO68380.1 hypothetical protein DBR40_20775 [Pedobacter sp. KBW01]